MIDPGARARMLDPGPVTHELPGIGGRIKLRCEDFLVDEIESYAPDGRQDRHLLVRMRKRDLSTPEALRLLGQALGIPTSDIGCAGRKDRRAVTTQWISVPAGAAELLARFAHPAVEIVEVHPHGQKLRTGHLRGNRFRVIVRELEVGPERALERVEAKLERLEQAGGLENLYAEQRFGENGENLDRGAELLVEGRRVGRSGRFLISALQSGLFNLYLGLRREQGWMRHVLPGDVLQRLDSGGMFTVSDPAAEQIRMDAGELVVTGPIFGTKMKSPAPGTASALLEEEVLREAGLGREVFTPHGKRLPGSRRALLVHPGDITTAIAPPEDGFEAGIELRFTLPAGSYATQLLRELQCGT